MGFHTGNKKDGNHYWLTPPDMLLDLREEFGFDFDACPHPLENGFDGLTCEWGRSTYVNPPFGSIMHLGKKKGPTAWARKAISEHEKGKSVVMVYSIDKWIHYLIQAGAELRSYGDVKWHSIEENKPGPGTSRFTMAFILRSRYEKTSRRNS